MSSVNSLGHTGSARQINCSNTFLWKQKFDRFATGGGVKCWKVYLYGEPINYYVKAPTAEIGNINKSGT